MAQEGDARLTEISAATTELEERARILNDQIGEYVGELATSGATTEQLTDLNRVGDSLGRMAEIVTAAQAVIDDTDIAILSPEFPEAEQTTDAIDENRAYELVRDHIIERAGLVFTLRELREYLEDQGIVIPPARFNRMFANWKDDIEQEVKESGKDVYFMKNPPGLSGSNRNVTTYVFADLNPEKMLARRPVRIPKGLTYGSNTDTSKVTPQGSRDRHQQVVDLVAALGATTKATRIKQEFARIHGRNMSEEEIGALFSEVVESGKLFTRRENGAAYYSFEPPAPRTSATLQKAKQEGDKSREPITEDQKKQARLILKAMTGRYAYANKPLTPQEIIRMAKKIDPSHELEVDTIKIITGYLQEIGIVRKTQGREGRSRARAKRLTVQKIGIASDSVMAALRRSGGISTAIRCLESGEPFVISE